MATLVSATDLAEWLGVSRQSVSEFANDGKVVRVSRGKYDLQASVQAYTAHLREVSAGRGGETQILDLTAERARLAKEQADAQALKNATARGEFLAASDVEREWSDILRRVRSGVLAVTSRVRMRAGIDAAQAEILDREIRDALTALADDKDDPPAGAGESPPAASPTAIDVDGADHPATG